MLFFVVVILALSLDAFFGEPIWLWSRLPHPVRGMGAAIHWADKSLNRGKYKKLKGVVAMGVLAPGFGVFAAGLAWLPDFAVLEIIGAAILIGQRSLVEHVAAVGASLARSLPEGRRAVSMIVGRDVAALDESAVARAAIESAAENFSDGVVAPVFWFLLFGLPGLVVYKLVNTADSMIGHRNEKYTEFGWAAARLDDVLNFVPARIAAGLIALSATSRKALETVRRDAGQHRSPNAGWPEAAMAGALDIALSGPRVYGGQPTNDAFVNDLGRKTLVVADISAAVHLLWKSWGLMLGIITMTAVFAWLFL